MRDAYVDSPEMVGSEVALAYSLVQTNLSSEVLMQHGRARRI